MPMRSGHFSNLKNMSQKVRPDHVAKAGALTSVLGGIAVNAISKVAQKNPVVAGVGATVLAVALGVAIYKNTKVAKKKNRKKK